MASATVDPPSDPLATIPTVDLRLLSQSDLYALSLSSSPSPTSSVVVPKINRSVFNESAGSRKQTYSRLRLAPRNPHHLSLSSPLPPPLKPDPESSENSLIISALKSLLSGGAAVTPTAEFPHPIPEIVGEKRKRGRPRRNPNFSSNPNPERNNVIKNIFVNKNNIGDVEMDKESVNGKGVEVGLGELARSEDPYIGELEKRSVGLRTEEEFLGFLGGLNGQWGSRRKKKRMVDAAAFGDALPRGWKLLLSLKKKEGRVWLHVRRYISPSGRHFISCKEVASYLISLLGLKDTNQPSSDQGNNYVQPTQETNNGNAADSAGNDIKESVKMKSSSPPLVCSPPDQKQITPVLDNSGDIQADNILNCEKCNMSFNEKDDYMHHQLSSHRRRKSKFGSSITDGVIIIDGQYECQFCHKRFVERHRYNGHVGAHKRHHLKNDEGSLNQVQQKESNLQASTRDDSNSVTDNYKNDGQSKPASPDIAQNIGLDTEIFVDQPYSEVNNLPHDEEVSQSILNTQSLAEQNCFEKDVDNKVKSSLDNLDEARFDASLESAGLMAIDETDTDGVLITNDFNDCRTFPIAQNNTTGEDIIMNEVSENISHALQENENMCNTDRDNRPADLLLEKTSEIDEVISEIKIDRSHSPSPVPVGNDEGYIDRNSVDMVSSSVLSETKQKRFSESDEEVMFGFKDIYNGRNSVSKADTPSNSEQVVSVSCLNIPSQTDELGDMADLGKVDIACTKEASGLGKSSEFGNASFHLSNINTRETEKFNIKETQTYRRNESSLGISHHQILRPEVRRPEFGIPLFSGHQQIFSENKSTGDNSVLSQQKRNLDNSFRSAYGLGNPFADVYSMNRFTNISTEEPKPDAVLNSSNSEIMIDFGNDDSEIVANPMDNVPMEQIFFEIDRSRESHRNREESKQESNLLGPSYYNKTEGSENYLDRIDTGSVWDGPILDGAGSDFAHEKLMIGFNNSGGQSHVDPMGANMWRTDERNTFQSNLAGSSSFLNANLISDKEDDMFLGFNGVQSAPTEHVEFSFMTPHSLNSFPRDSKTMFNSAMAQGFDSSFWLEKDDLSLNIAARNLVTSICVWCRNEFRHEPDNSGTQNGAIGSICPTCSARVMLVVYESHSNPTGMACNAYHAISDKGDQCIQSMAGVNLFNCSRTYFQRSSGDRRLDWILLRLNFQKMRFLRRLGLAVDVDIRLHLLRVLSNLGTILVFKMTILFGVELDCRIMFVQLNAFMSFLVLFGRLYALVGMQSSGVVHALLLKQDLNLHKVFFAKA